MLSLQKAMIYPPDIPTSNPLEESRQKSEEKVKRFRRIQEGIDDAGDRGNQKYHLLCYKSSPIA